MGEEQLVVDNVPLTSAAPLQPFGHHKHDYEYDDDDADHNHDNNHVHDHHKDDKNDHDWEWSHLKNWIVKLLLQQEIFRSCFPTILDSCFFFVHLKT